MNNLFTVMVRRGTRCGYSFLISGWLLWLLHMS